MFKNLLRIGISLVGTIVGYGVYKVLKILLLQTKTVSPEWFTPGKDLMISLSFVIIFFIIFFVSVPAFTRRNRKVTKAIENDLQGFSTNDLVAGTAGLVVGLLIAYLVSNIYAFITIQYVSLGLTVVTYLVFGYLGVVVATRKSKDLFNIFFRETRDRMPGGVVGRRSKQKHAEQRPKIFDTSVIIDGRIYDIMKTGFIEGPIVIPDFVLVELRHIADSSDGLKRKRGRRGLDVLNQIQEEFGVDIYDTANEKSLKEIPEVDVKLLKLAQNMNGKVVTNDFNLNKVAGINNVDVLNINELANTLKPVVLPGESMSLFLVKEGKEQDQGVAYLDDGTMIVVEGGRKYIGKNVDITVTSVLQTSAGRMIFGKPKTKDAR